MNDDVEAYRQRVRRANHARRLAGLRPLRYGDPTLGAAPATGNAGTTVVGLLLNQALVTRDEVQKMIEDETAAQRARLGAVW